jgi:cellulose synthase (UDP-forming)
VTDSVADDEQEPARPERRIPGALYGRTATELTGPLRPTANRVEYRAAFSRREHWQFRCLGLLHVGLAVALAVYLLLPGNLPALHALGLPVAILTVTGLAVMIGLQVIVALRTWVLTFFAA